MANGIQSSLQELLQYQRCFTKKIPPKKVRAQQSGQHLSSFRGRGMDFSEVRSYQAGDDIRQMEWRVTARTGKPHIKLYHEEKERPIFILADYNPSMYFGSRVAYKSVIASRFGAMLGFAASHHGDRVGGMVYSGDQFKDIRPRARKNGVLALVQQLSEFSMHRSKTSCPLDKMLLQLRQVVKPGALVFILSDFEYLGPLVEAYLKRLCLRADVVCYLISDPLERHAPKPGQYAITNGLDEMIIDTSSEKLRQQYNMPYQNKVNFLNKIIKPGRLVELSTDDDLDIHLQHAFASFHDWRR